MQISAHEAFQQINEVQNVLKKYFDDVSRQAVIYVHLCVFW